MKENEYYYDIKKLSKRNKYTIASALKIINTLKNIKGKYYELIYNNNLIKYKIKNDR